MRGGRPKDSSMREVAASRRSLSARILFWGACVASLGTSCVSASPEIGGQIWVFTDGSHSGLVLPAHLAPLRPDIRHEALLGREQHHFIEYGYSDRGWFDGTGRSPRHLWRLVFGVGDGVVVVRMYRSQKEALEGKRASVVTVDQKQLAALGAEMRRWIDWRRPVEVYPDEVLAYAFASRVPYHVLRNCNHFTATMLRVMEEESPGETP